MWVRVRGAALVSLWAAIPVLLVWPLLVLVQLGVLLVLLLLLGHCWGHAGRCQVCRLLLLRVLPLLLPNPSRRTPIAIWQMVSSSK